MRPQGLPPIARKGTGLTEASDLLSVAEAAEYAHVHKDTIHRWFHDGLPKLQPTGPYGGIRIEADELGAFLRRNAGDRRHRLLAEIRAETERVHGIDDQGVSGQEGESWGTP